MGLKLGQLPVRYLGVPLISQKLRDVDCKCLIEKITARISSWTARYLSYAGRWQLVSSILASMYTGALFSYCLKNSLERWKDYVAHFYGKAWLAQQWEKK